MSGSVSDYDGFKLWRTLHDKIIRGRHPIESPHAVNTRDPNSPAFTFEQLCTHLGVQNEFDNLLVKIRSKVILPPDLAARAEVLATQQAVARDARRRLKASEYQTARRSSKAAQWRAQLELAANTPVSLGGIPKKE